MNTYFYQEQYRYDIVYNVQYATLAFVTIKTKSINNSERNRSLILYCERADGITEALQAQNECVSCRVQLSIWWKKNIIGLFLTR